MRINREEFLSRLKKIDPYRFEHFVADLWECMGWKAEVTEASKDGGIDVIASRDILFRQTHYIQAKRYSTQKVKTNTVREYSSLHRKHEHENDQVDIVVLVTTTSFTEPAKKEARKLNVKIVNGEMISELVFNNELSDIAEKYNLCGQNNTQQEYHHADLGKENVEDYRGTEQWTWIEAFNEKVIGYNDEEFELVATANGEGELKDGKTLYTLTHGYNTPKHGEDRINLHTIQNATKEQKDRIKRLKSDLSMRFTVADSLSDDVIIYDKIQDYDPKNTERTVKIGMMIASRIYNESFSNTDLDVN